MGKKMSKSEARESARHFIVGLVNAAIAQGAGIGEPPEVLEALEKEILKILPSPKNKNG